MFGFGRGTQSAEFVAFDGGVPAPPAGYLQWLYGGNSTTLPTQDKVGIEPLPILNGDSLTQSSLHFIGKIEVVGAGYNPTNGVYRRIADRGGLGAWGRDKPAGGLVYGDRLSYENGKWEKDTSGIGHIYGSALTTSPYPPKGNWAVGSGSAPAPTIEYACIWVDAAGEFASVSMSSLKAHTAGTDGVYVVLDSAGEVAEILTFPDALTGVDLEVMNDYIAYAALPATQSSYPAPTVGGPAVAPIFPASFKSFTPPIDEALTPAANTPVLAEWTRTNQPSDTMALTGYNLSTFTGDDEGKDTAFLFYGQSQDKGQVLSAPSIQRLDDQQTVLTLPASLPSDSFYLLWPRNVNGEGTPVTINKTEAWWIGPDETSDGKTFSVYGINLSLNNQRCWIYIEEEDIWLQSVSQNKYKADFVLPSLDNGAYTIWTHNGQGRVYGWGKSLTLNVVTATDWEAETSTTYNVKDFGATGTGSTDDYSFVVDALNAASAGDTVWFPAGTYALSSNLSGKCNGKRIMGDGWNSIITTYSSNSQISFHGGTIYDAVFKDIVIESGDYGSASEYSIFDNMGGSSRNLLFDNVKFDYSADTTTRSGECLQINNSHHIQFHNCEFILHHGIFMTDAALRQIAYYRCVFKGMHDVGSFVKIQGGIGLSFEECTFKNLNNISEANGYGWCRGRAIVLSGTHNASGSQRYFYFGENTTVEMQARDGGLDENSGEQLLIESANIKHIGAVVTGTPTTAVFSSLPSYCLRRAATIISGKGLGQTRYVTGTTSTTITVDPAWNITPDNTSIINIAGGLQSAVIHNNYFQGTAKAISEAYINASAGVQFYGATMETVVDGNTFDTCRKGSAEFPFESVVNGYLGLSPNYFNVFLNNLFTNCRSSIFRSTEVGNTGYTMYPSILGTIYRDNTSLDATFTAIDYTPKYNDNYRVADLTVWERNVCTDNASLFAGGGAAGYRQQLWIDNNFTTTVGGDGLLYFSGDETALRGNTFSGFDNDYIGSLSSNILEIPQRVFALDATTLTGSIQVWNSGPTSMAWTATDDAAWLTLGSSSGTVTDQADQDLISFTADPDGLGSGTYTAEVTVTAGSSVKKIRITLTI